MSNQMGNYAVPPDHWHSEISFSRTLLLCSYLYKVLDF